MTEHQAVRELLSLAAAGALDRGERELVDRHLAGCEACRREFEAWSGYARGLGHLPQPEVPRDLLQRTQARVLQARSVRTQRANTPLLVLGLSFFGWSVSYLVWFLLHAATGGEFIVLQTNVLRLEVWAVASTALVWTSGAVAAILLAQSRTEWREAL